MIQNRIIKIVALTLLSGLCLCGQAISQDKSQQTRQLWDDFMHYAVIGNWEVAIATGQALIEAQPDPIQLLDLAESSRYANAYRDLILLQKDTPLKAVAEDILKLVEEGRRQKATEVERIATEVKRLSSTTRGRMLALERLKDSGEYAIPVMVAALRDPERSEELDVIRWALPQIGKSAVKPLLVVLQRSGDLSLQMIMLEVLGKIGYPEALPYIKAIIEDEQATPELKNIAIRTFKQIASNMLPTDISAAGLFEKNALDYYNHEPSLMAPAHMDQANIWFWDSRVGLFREVVPRDAFEELMAMRAAEDAVRLDKSRPDSIALWLSAFFRLETEGFQQPAYFDARHEHKIKDYLCQNTGMLPEAGPGHADASTYALTAGPEYLHRVLARALNDNNRPVALEAIKVLNRNAGQEALLFELENKRPLIDAMSFSDRQVRFAAALAIGGLLPGKVFEGREQVVQILGEALRQHGRRYALVASPDAELRSRITLKLREAGFDGIENDEFYSRALQRVIKSPSLDVMILTDNIQHPSLDEVLASIKKDYRLAFCPTIILAEPEKLSVIRNRVTEMSFVQVLPINSPEQDIFSAVDAILKTNNAVAFSADLADFYAGSAAMTLRELALTHNKVLPIIDAESALIEALRDSRPDIQIAAIESLAHLNSMPSQRSLADMALDSALDLVVRKLSFANLSISARQYGNLLASEQILSIYTDIVNSKDVDVELRNMAAQAYGSLNLPSGETSKLILEQAR